MFLFILFCVSSFIVIFMGFFMISTFKTEFYTISPTNCNMSLYLNFYSYNISNVTYIYSESGRTIDDYRFKSTNIT